MVALGYHGDAFHGSQVQPDIRTVEGALIAMSTAFDPLTEVRWATPDDPEGRSLDYSVVGGMLNVRIPRLDAYGVLTVTAP